MLVNNTKLLNSDTKETNNMKTLINKTYTGSFDAVFMENAVSFSTKLTFTTREEYLDWVKQWKTEYKLVQRQHTIEKYSCRRNHSITAVKQNHYQKMIDKIPAITAEERSQYDGLMNRFRTEIGLPTWFACSYSLILYMLIYRKAGKIRANVQRNLRLLLVK